MIKFSIVFLLFLSSFAFSQNIGIVYNINPKMGFAVANNEFYNSGLFTKKAISEQDTDYNFINFIEDYYQKKNSNSKIFSDFDFLQVKYIYSADDLKYIKKYCFENKIDELIIVIKNYEYVPYDPMETYKFFDHDFGIVSHKKLFYKATLYGNFYIFLYDAKNNTVKKKFDNRLLVPKRFNKSVFDKETYDLQNDEVLEYFIPEFEKNVIKKLKNK